MEQTPSPTAEADLATPYQAQEEKDGVLKVDTVPSVEGKPSMVVGKYGDTSNAWCNVDAGWGVLFWLHLVGLAGLTAYYVPTAVRNILSQVNDQNNWNENAYEDEDGDEDGRWLLSASSRWLEDEDEEFTLVLPPGTLALVLGVSSLFALAVSGMAVAFVMCFAKTFIQVALIWNIVLCLILSIFTAMTGQLGVTLLTLMVGMVAAWYAYVVWSKIPFAAANLRTAIAAIRPHWASLFTLSVWHLLLGFGYTLWWALTWSAVAYVVNECGVDGTCQADNLNQGGVAFAFFLSFYWTAQVLKNVLHTTVAGTVGTWWFVPTFSQGRPVLDSYVRSMTKSFGSICLASLVVALVQTVKELVHQLRGSQDSWGMILCMLECCLECIEALAEYINQWALIYVALYGQSFVQSGKSVLELFRAKGWSSIIADVLVDAVLRLLIVGIAVLTGLLSSILLWTLVANDNVGQAKVWIGTAGFVLGLVLGGTVAQLVVSCIASAVPTVIVCFAEGPAEFQEHHPDESVEMRLAWKQAYPNEYVEEN